MQKKRNMEESLEDALNSLDGLRKASPAPFFFTRVQARIQREQNSQWSIISSFIARPVVAVAGISIVVLLNIAALFYQKEHSAAAMLTDQNDTATTDDYNTTVATNSYYDENIEPR
jgi:hypothetical protein